ncbi:hypothetical protein IJH06_01075 [Candidatus Saccharibacteria bacterium]|nr:hypothetical protein [Candidatus Saccharibacteria bacterium]
MAKEVAISKRAKISQAQKYMLIAVLGTGAVLGVAIAVVMRLVAQISFNAKVMTEEDKAMATYTSAIRSIGICKKPAGSVYTDEELKACKPNSIDVATIPGTLRANILDEMAENEYLNSVPKESDSTCLNSVTGKSYTYTEMQEIYDAAVENGTTEEIMAASELIQLCSALRVIPDALPAFKNEEALLSSLNKIFLLSDWEPETLSPTGTSAGAEFGNNLNTFSVRLAVEADSETTLRVLNNIERSIREFNIERATIEWSSDNTLALSAQATAYYMTPTTLSESNKVMRAGSK